MSVHLWTKWLWVRIPLLSVKVNNSYSLWSLIKYGVPQGANLGPILFNIFLCDIFFLVDITSYADYNTPYAIGIKRTWSWKQTRKYDFENKLEIVLVKLFRSLQENDMKANQHKCLDITTKLLLFDCSIENSSSRKILETMIDRKLYFVP